MATMSAVVVWRRALSQNLKKKHVHFAVYFESKFILKCFIICLLHVKQYNICC